MAFDYGVFAKQRMSAAQPIMGSGMGMWIVSKKAASQVFQKLLCVGLGIPVR